MRPEDQLVALTVADVEAIIADLALASEKFDIAGMTPDAAHYALAAYRLRRHALERPAWHVERLDVPA